MAKKNEGKKFEEDIQASVPKEWFCYRLKDSSGSWSNTEVSRFTPKNMCDFFIFTGETLYGVECKSFRGKSVPYSMLNDKKSVKLNQMVAMSNIYGAYGCYFLNFRDLAETYIVSSVVVKELRLEGSRKSMSYKQVKEYGYKIPQQLKKVRYRYGLKSVL